MYYKFVRYVSFGHKFDPPLLGRHVHMQRKIEILYQMTKTEMNQVPPWKVNGNELKLFVYKIAYYSNEHVESFFELEIIKK